MILKEFINFIKWKEPFRIFSILSSWASCRTYKKIADIISQAKFYFHDPPKNEVVSPWKSNIFNKQPTAPNYQNDNSHSSIFPYYQFCIFYFVFTFLIIIDEI